MSSDAYLIPSADKRAAIRLAFKTVANALTALIAGLVLLGWALGDKSLAAVVPGTIPMHPLTAILFALSAVALFLTGGAQSRTTRSVGLACAIFIPFAGLSRLAADAAGIGHAIDRLFFPTTLARMSRDFASTSIRTTPASSLNFLLIGVALVITCSRRRRFKLTAFVLTVTSMFVSVMTVAYSANIASVNDADDWVPVRCAAAIGFLFLTAGVLAELYGPAFTLCDASARYGPSRASFTSPDSIGFAAAILMLLGIGIVSYKSINQFVADSRWESRKYQVLATIHALRADLKDAESDTRGYVITGEPRYLEFYQTATEAIGPKVQTLKALTRAESTQQRRIEIVIPLIDQKLKVMRQKQARSRGLEVGTLPALVSEGERLMEGVDRGLHEMEAEENQLLTNRLAGTEHNANRAIRLITIGATMALVLVILAGWMINRDIAGRVRIEAALRSSDTMFRGLLEAAPDAMVIVNEGGGIEFFNAQAELMFGYAAEELRGQPIELLVPLRYRNEHVSKRDSFFAAPVVRGMGVGSDLFGVRKDGTEFPVEISLSPLHTAEGLRVSSAIRDVTRQKREAEELRSLNYALERRTTQLEVANRELESFSYSVSHDLRAPLRSIDGFSLALLEDNAGKLNAESQDHLRRIRAASQRMGHLIDDLLNLARVTRIDMSREKVDLSQIAREVIDELRSSNGKHEVEFVVADGLVGEADPRLLRIVLANLLGNAMKFTSGHSQPRIEFGYRDEVGNRGFFIRDNGVGFDMNYAGKLFGAFQRLHSASDFPGTGIGLATVQRIVHRHGGRVWASGEPQKGATFYFDLACQT